jgi:GTPase SAR1 family protein
MGIKKASTIRKKPLKILLYGDSGVGKTHFALQASPNKTLVFDAESGTDMFEGRKGFEFDYWTDDDGLKTASIRELNKAIDYLSTSEGRENYESFVIDPISDIWDNIQAQRLEYKDEKKVKDAQKYNKTIDLDSRNETDLENFNQRDWGDMKRIYKNMMLKLKNLPQNVILIAREKEISETKPNGDIVRTGEYTFEAEKNTKYAVDFTVRLTYDDKKKERTAVISKTRNSSLEKGEIIKNPSFSLFDKVVNSMSAGENVVGMSEKEENIFSDTDKTDNDTDVEFDIDTISIEALKPVLLNLCRDKATNNRPAVDEIMKDIKGKNPNNITDINVAKNIYTELSKI